MSVASSCRTPRFDWENNVHGARGMPIRQGMLGNSGDIDAWGGGLWHPTNHKGIFCCPDLWFSWQDADSHAGTTS